MENAETHEIHAGCVLGGPKLISDEDVRAILGLKEDVEIVVR